MTENTKEEIKKDPIQTDFEEAIAAKDKRIYTLKQEKKSALSSAAKLVTELDNVKAEKEVAEARAERAEARYLRTNESKDREQPKKEQAELLKVLFE